MLLKAIEFAEAVGLSRQMISKHVKNGTIVKTGTKIDTEEELNKIFINSDSSRRSKFYRYSKKIEGGKTHAEKPKKKVTPGEQKIVPAAGDVYNDDYEEPEEKKDEIIPGNGNKALSDADIERGTKMAKFIKEQNKAAQETMETQKRRNELAVRVNMKFVIERFLNHFVTEMPRVSNTSLTDVCKKVLSEGSVTNEHFKIFEDACMEMIDGAKKKLLSDIKNRNLGNGLDS